MSLSDLLFTLRIQTPEGCISIEAFDAHENEPGYHFAAAARIDVRVKLAGRVIFERGDTWCRTPRMGAWSLDGIETRELILSLVAMKPGDTDSEYFENYTPIQLEFAEKYGDEISMVRESRYCDENGNVRRKRT